MTSRRIAVVGSGYVGTVVAAAFAAVGHDVAGLEIDPNKLATLQAGRAPFFEPGLDDLIRSGIEKGNLSFTAKPSEAVTGAGLIFFCVGTPSDATGRPDMTAMESAAVAVGAALQDSCVLVTKSTVPIGSGDWLEDTIRSAIVHNGHGPIEVAIASNPEFLREGSAVADFLHPERVVIGSRNDRAVETLAAAYQPILDQSFAGGDRAMTPTLVRTDLATAETIKYAANAFLATKVSFINEISRICDLVGADVVDVARGVGLDSRIGSRFFAAGIGWGGSCFGKDIGALAATAADFGYKAQMLEATVDINRRQREHVAERLLLSVGPLPGKKVTLLGLAFKPGTDDLRDAPSLYLASRLIAAGARISAYDPAVRAVPGLDIEVHDDAYAAVQDADAVVLVTEWPEFLQLDLAGLKARMRGTSFFDGRNLFDPVIVAEAGLRYDAFGRGRHRTIGAGLR